MHGLTVSERMLIYMNADQDEWKLDFVKLKNGIFPEDPVLIAFHEAGHMVAAFICKLQIGRLTIRAEDDATGTSKGRSAHGVPEPLWKRLEDDPPFAKRITRRLIITSISARLSEPLCPSYVPNDASISDKVDEISMAFWCVYGQVPMTPYLRPTGQIFDLLVKIKRRTERIVQTKRFQRAVERLAFAAVGLGIIQGDEVVSIIEQALTKTRAE